VNLVCPKGQPPLILSLSKDAGAGEACPERSRRGGGGVIVAREAAKTRSQVPPRFGVGGHPQAGGGARAA